MHVTAFDQNGTCANAGDEGIEGMLRLSTTCTSQIFETVPRFRTHSIEVDRRQWPRVMTGTRTLWLQWEHYCRRTRRCVRLSANGVTCKNYLIKRTDIILFHCTTSNSLSSYDWSYGCETGSSDGSEYCRRYSWLSASSAVILVSGSRSSIRSSRSMAA